MSGSWDFLKSKTVYIRPLLLKDISERYVQWFCSLDNLFYSNWLIKPQSEFNIREFISSNSAPDFYHFAIITREKDIHVGNCSLGRVDWINRNAEISIFFGEKESHKKSAPKEVLILLLEYGFMYLDLERIFAGTTNIGVVLLLQKCGFKREGTRRKHVKICDELYDLYELGILKEEYVKIRNEAIMRYDIQNYFKKRKGS